MRKVRLLVAAMTALILPFAGASAQGDAMIFNHLSVGLDIGTRGFGLEVTAPLTPYLEVRTGFDIMPHFGYTYDVNLENVKIGNSTPEMLKMRDGTYKTGIKGTLNMTDWKLMFDAFPFRKSSFHVTAGMFVGSSEFVSVTNTNAFGEDLSGEFGAGINLKDGSRIKADDDGFIHAKAKVNGFKPYVGIGFGRAISDKHRVSVACDIGALFWGKPQLAIQNTHNEESIITAAEFDDKDAEKAFDIVSKVIAYPLLNLRIIYRIF